MLEHPKVISYCENDLPIFYHSPLRKGYNIFFTGYNENDSSQALRFITFYRIGPLSKALFKENSLKNKCFLSVKHYRLI